MPDYATQLALGTASTSNTETLDYTLTQSGTFHVTVCDVNGVGGDVRLTVTQPR